MENKAEKERVDALYGTVSPDEYTKLRSAIKWDEDLDWTMAVYREVYISGDWLHVQVRVHCSVCEFEWGYEHEEKIVLPSVPSVKGREKEA
jgi:hypothetical protein